MSATFYREAFHAAVGGKSHGGIGDEHFTKWEKLAEALDRLCPELPCNAVYADWLLQLHYPAHRISCRSATCPGKHFAEYLPA